MSTDLDRLLELAWKTGHIDVPAEMIERIAADYAQVIAMRDRLGEALYNTPGPWPPKRDDERIAALSEWRAAKEGK